MFIRQLDVVALTTVDNVDYLSSPPGQEPDPRGEWRVANVFNGKLLLTKGLAVIRVPESDVLLISKKLEVNDGKGQ